MNVWNRIEKKLMPPEVWKKDPLTLWKERAVFSIFLVMLVFGFIALVPSLYFAYILDLKVVFVSDLIIFFLILVVFFSRKLSLKKKTWAAMLIFYALGTMLLFTVGFYGAGYIWLFVASLIGGMILDNKSAVFMLMLNLTSIIAVGVYIQYGQAEWVADIETPIQIWLVIGANFVTVNILTAFFIGGIKTSIEEALERQIAAQRASLEEVRFSENLINSMPGLFFLFEHEQETSRLKRWNKNLETTMKYSPEELKDLDIHKLFNTEHPHQINELEQQLIRQGRVVVEFEVLRKNQHPIPLHLEAFSFKREDTRYFIGSAIDISQRLAEEKEKEQMQKRLAAAQKTGALGTLASGIAHDFNNILSGIQGFAELVKIDSDDRESVENGIDQILGGSRRAGELVRQILTFNRQAENEKQPMKLYLIVKEALKFLRSSIPPTIEIRDNINCRTYAYADTTQIHQVVLNLCTNAYHAMRQTGGVLSVSLGETQVLKATDVKGLYIRPGNYLLLKVEDTGHGMSKETASRIFEPYFTTKEATEGTGLGLAVVSGIIQDHNGYITVDSEVDKGTCFDIYLPVWNGDASQVGKDGSETQDPVVSPSQEKIMLVDDERGIRMSLKELLEGHGYEVEIYPDGSQALERFLENPDYFDLLVTDISMPRMSGEKLAEEVKKIRPDLPIIMFTGYSDFTEDMARDLGIEKYLEKPVGGKALLGMIREILAA